MIVMAYQELARNGRRLAICSPSDRVSRILEITGLNLEGLVYPTTAEALAAQSAARSEVPAG
ncbi:MAG: hypothetical protein JSS68_05415 [Actinobacteria bacterium]|nr:hypothetical protein [Actinomycetota bacterium]